MDAVLAIAPEGKDEILYIPDSAQGIRVEYVQRRERRTSAHTVAIAGAGRTEDRQVCGRNPRP